MKKKGAGFYSFYHRKVDKKSFEEMMEEAMLFYNAGLDLPEEKVAGMLAYCRDKYITKSAGKVRSDLAWLRLAVGKKEDIRYDLSSVYYDGEWTYATDGMRVHAVRRQVIDGMGAGDKYTGKGEVITPTAREEYDRVKKLEKGGPELEKLRGRNQDLVEISLKLEMEKTIGIKDMISDTYKVEGKAPMYHFNGELVAFNRQFLGDILNYRLYWQVYTTYTTGMNKPFIFMSNNEKYLGMIMPL